MSRVSVINKPRRIKPGEAGHGNKKFVVKVKQGDKQRRSNTATPRWRSNAIIQSAVKIFARVMVAIPKRRKTR